MHGVILHQPVTINILLNWAPLIAHAISLVGAGGPVARSCTSCQIVIPSRASLSACLYTTEVMQVCHIREM